MQNLELPQELNDKINARIEEFKKDAAIVADLKKRNLTQDQAKSFLIEMAIMTLTGWGMPK